MIAETGAEAGAERYVTHCRGCFNGKEIGYTVIAADLHLSDPAGKPRAAIFSYSYLMDEPGDPRGRPVTFLFNGGPGAASLWLHMGAFGPKRVTVPSDAVAAGAGPFEPEDNPLCPLDATDLVFIDPVGTGFSRALGEAKDEEFFGVEADAESVAQFIARWLTLHRRWASPRYLGGESYGAVRTVAVAGRMHGEMRGVTFNGLMLISGVLDFQTLQFDKGNIVPDISYLPTYAATALHHGRIEAPAGRAALLEEVRRFALDDYAPALLAGSRLEPARRREILARLARYTGLGETWLDRADLRIQPGRFRKELLRDEEVSLNRYDARYRCREPEHAGELPDGGEGAAMIAGAFTAAINDYLTRGLGIENGRAYLAINAEAGAKWKWQGPGKSGIGSLSLPAYLNFASELGRLQREIPDMKVWVAHGLYDLGTPFFGVENSLAGNGIDAARVTMTYYPAGHMMYLHEPSLVDFLADFRALLVSAPAAERSRT